MFLPTLVSMEEVLDHLQENLEFDNTVDFTLVVREILLYELQNKVTQFGPGREGAVGAFLAQNTAEDSRFTEFDISRIIHEAGVLATDAIALAIPSLKEDSNPIAYIFRPGDIFAIVYVPCTDPQALEQHRGKLVPPEAVRVLLAGF